MKFKIREFEKLHSTNDHLKQLIATESAEEGLVILANEQTNGKGQQGNSWESESGKNLTFSLLLQPNIYAGDMFLISKLISVAITNILAKQNITTTIKWPNDIYYKNNKLGGILIENQLIGSDIKYSTIGIGININQTEFYSDAPNPISLKNISDKEYVRNTILQELLDEINALYLNHKDVSTIEKLYWKNLYRNSDWYNYKTQKDGMFKAKITTVENDGQLILETETGEKKGFYFKEVEFII